MGPVTKFLIILLVLASVKCQSDLSSLFPLGGITLSHEGNFYEITTQECPGGIFFKKIVNETCLCYNGIFAVVRKCCANNDSMITTETLEWRKNYQCGMSPEIGNPGEQAIKAILPLTKAESPFQPFITFKEFSGENFLKWRKFDLRMLSNSPNPIAFKDGSEVEIVNIRPLNKLLTFKMGKYGDVDICYKGWTPEGPQSLRVSIYTYVKPKSENCCFQIRSDNSPGIITSSCRGGSIITEIVDIESVNTGNSCPIQGKKEKSIALAKNSWINRPPKGLIRFKRFVSSTDIAEPESDSFTDPFRLKRDDTLSAPAVPPKSATKVDSKSKADVLSEPQHPIDAKTLVSSAANPSSVTKVVEDENDGSTVDVVGEDETEPKPPSTPRYPLTDLQKDTIEEQNKKLRVHTTMRKRKMADSIREPETQRFILLKKSMELFHKFVPEEFVPPMLIEDGFEAFYYLYESLDQVDDHQRLSKKEFQRTLDCLGNCSERHKPWKEIMDFMYKNGSCPLELTEVNITLENGTKIENIPASLPPDWLIYDKTKHDMIVEINWKLVDFVQTICFEEFFDDYNAHHFYENQMEILFLQTYVQNRWFRSILPTDNYAKGTIGTIDKNSRMIELDKALSIAHILSRYKPFLHRPSPEILLPESPIYKLMTLYEEAVTLKSQLLKRSKIYNGENDVEDNDIDGSNADGNGMDPNDNWEDGRGVGRKKKHISVHKPEYNIAKPGDTIWNGLAVCLDGKTNDDPAYYTQEELWGTTPSLSELEEKYPWTNT